MNLNRNQILAIAIAVLGVIMGSTAQLTDLFGPTATKTILSAASLSSSIMSAVLAFITGQSGQVKDVLAMPGIAHVSVNADATPTLAAIAVDQSQPKISPIPADAASVAEIAKG